MRVVGKLLKHAAASLYMQTKKKKKRGFIYIYIQQPAFYCAGVVERERERKRKVTLTSFTYCQAIVLALGGAFSGSLHKKCKRVFFHVISCQTTCVRTICELL